MQDLLPSECGRPRSSTDPATHSIHVMRECVRAWLLEVRARMLEEEELAQRIHETRFRLDGLTSSQGAGRGSLSGDARMSEGIGHLMDLQRDLAEAVSVNKAFIANAMELCPPRETARYACWLHWARGLSWPRVARRLSYSESNVKHDLYDKGVSQLYPLIPEEFRRYTFPNAAPK